MENAYTPPQADLKQPDQNAGKYGSVETAKSGNWDFAIGETIKESWALVKGTKGSFFAAMVIYVIIALVVTQVPLFFMAFSSANDPILINVVGQFLNLLIVPLMLGISMMGIRRSMSKDISFSQMFEYYSKLVPIILLNLFILLLVLIGLALLVLPGIYLGLSYFFAMVLMVDKNMGIWEAMETSRKGVTKHWFKILGFFIVIFIIMFISAIPFGIGLIWTGPLGCIAYGVLYRDIFGVSKAAE